MSLLKTVGLGLVGTIASLGFAQAAAAAPIVYSFTNASYSNASDSATLTGSFTWDTTTRNITSSNINVTGVDNGHAVNCVNCSSFFFDPTHFAIGTNYQTLYITFGASLNDGGVVPLSLVAFGQGNEPEYQGRSAFTSATGAASAVPEAATWAMMILGMGMVGAALRRRVRASEVKFDAKIKRIEAGEIA